MGAPGKSRSLTLRILRSAPGAHLEPQWQDFAVEEGEGMTLFIALNEHLLIQLTILLSLQKKKHITN